MELRARAVVAAAAQSKAETAGEKCDPGQAQVPAGILSVPQPEPFTSTYKPSKKLFGRRITELKGIFKVLARTLYGWGGKLGSELPLTKFCWFAWRCL